MAEVELVMLAYLDRYVQLMKPEQNRDSMMQLEKEENLIFFSSPIKLKSIYMHQTAKEVEVMFD